MQTTNNNRVLLRLKNISKSFKNQGVLFGINLEITESKLVSILGESGSGKTTLLRTIAGLEQPDSGSIEIDGTIVNNPAILIPPEKRKIGYVPQDGSLFPHLTVSSNISFGLSFKERRSGRIKELIELVGLNGLEKRYPNQLSGGQVQKVALARALAIKPRLLLLDEPFSAMDPRLRESIREETVKIIRGQNITAILVTHQQDEALSVSDYVAVLREGRIVQIDTPQGLYLKPADRKLAAFVGEANFVKGRCLGAFVSSRFGNLMLDAEQSQGYGDEVTCIVRPEQIKLLPYLSDHDKEKKAIGIVKDLKYYGHDALVEVSIDTEKLYARVAHGPYPEIGTQVIIQIVGTVTII